MSRLVPEEETTKKDKRKQKASDRKQAAGAKQVKFLASILSGDFLSKENIIKNLPFMFYVTALLVAYIGYGYYVDRTSRNIADLQEQSRELNADQHSEDAYYNQLKMSSNLVDSLAEDGLQLSDQSMTKIKVPRTQFDTRQ